MNFETAADSFIRPAIGRQAEPAHAAVQARQETAAETTRGTASEQGAKAEHETAAMEIEFADLLDVINPLQHIPVMASLYRELTGDEIKAPARVLGGFLFGGPVGLVASVANAAIEESSGRDLGETVMAWAFGADDSASNLAEVPPTADSVAQVAPAAGAATAGAAPTAVQMPTSQMPATVLAPEDAAARATDSEAPAEPAAQLSTQSSTQPTMGTADAPMLSGKAAINAFLNDLKAVGRSAAGATAVPAENAMAAQSAERTPASRVPKNLVGLGSRDQRGRSVATPAASLPPATLQIPGAAGGPATIQTTGDSPTQAATQAATGVSGEADPQVSAQPAAAPADFSAQMMEALQKYQSMLQQRGAGSGS